MIKPPSKRISIPPQPEKRDNTRSALSPSYSFSQSLKHDSYRGFVTKSEWFSISISSSFVIILAIFPFIQIDYFLSSSEMRYFLLKTFYDVFYILLL